MPLKTVTYFPDKFLFLLLLVNSCHLLLKERNYYDNNNTETIDGKGETTAINHSPK